MCIWIYLKCVCLDCVHICLWTLKQRWLLGDEFKVDSLLCCQNHISPNLVILNFSDKLQWLFTYLSITLLNKKISLTMLNTGEFVLYLVNSSCFGDGQWHFILIYFFYLNTILSFQLCFQSHWCRDNIPRAVPQRSATSDSVDVTLSLSVISNMESQQSPCWTAMFLWSFIVSTHNLLHLCLIQHSFSFERQTTERNDNLTSLKMHSDPGALEASISK